MAAKLYDVVSTVEEYSSCKCVVLSWFVTDRETPAVPYTPR